jgi:hypothetical protein
MVWTRVSTVFLQSHSERRGVAMVSTEVDDLVDAAQREVVDVLLGDEEADDRDAHGCHTISV